VVARQHNVFLRRALAVTAVAGLLTLAVGPAPAMASVINATLADVSCTSATSCMAVGSAEDTSGKPAYITLAEQWNGSTWSVLSTPTPPNPGGGGELSGVSCASSTDCVAVGETLVFDTSGGFLISHPLVESWDGSAWTIVTTPKLAHTGAVLNGVACTAASSCMAVGSEGGVKDDTEFTFAQSWNGTAWTIASTPAPKTPGGTALNRISCTAADSCMAAGYYGYNNGTGTSVTLTESWNGKSWHRLSTPTPGSSGLLAGVSCAAASSCTSVGWHSVNSRTLSYGTLAEQWNGTKWQVQSSQNPKSAGGAILDDASCTAVTNCMAVGYWVDQEGENNATLAESWNGTSWTLLKTPDPGSMIDELFGLSCTSAANCMAVGDQQGIGNGLTLAESWNGTAWSVVATPQA
jgi:hypothetical protein